MAGAHNNMFKINLLNCSEGGRKDQQFENQFGQLQRWQAQRTSMQLDPTITLGNCTATINLLNPPMAAADTHILKINLVNCQVAGAAQRPRIQPSLW